MKILIALILCTMFSGAALAQQYKWVDENGRTRYGDVPPPGVKATRLRGASSAPAPAPSSAAKDGAAKDGKAASKEPLSHAEKDADFRKRQLEAEKAREKDEKATQQAQEKQENCARAREQMASIDSGQRISRTNAQGERYFLEDDQRAQEAAKTQQLVSQWCK